LELLSTPLHLSLYLQGNPRSAPQFNGVQDLLGRYWTHKRQIVSDRLQGGDHCFEIIKTLVDRLSRDQTLSAPAIVLDQFNQREVNLMASHNVIAFDG